MFKTITATFAIAGCLSVGEVANADSPWKEPRNGHHWSDYEEIDRHGGHKTLKKDLRRTVRYDEIPLRRLFRLNNRYAGFRVESVSVKLKGNGNRGRVRLMVNGRITDSKRLQDRQLLDLRPTHNSVIGKDLKSLRLEIQGRAFVKSVKVHLRPAKFVRHRRWDRVWTLHHDYWGEPLPKYTPPIADKLEGAPSGHNWTPRGYYLGGGLPRYTPSNIDRADNVSNCRDYTVWGFIGGFEQQIAGTACRKVGSSWRTDSN